MGFRVLHLCLTISLTHDKGQNTQRKKQNILSLEKLNEPQHFRNINDFHNSWNHRQFICSNISHNSTTDCIFYTQCPPKVLEHHRQLFFLCYTQKTFRFDLKRWTLFSSWYLYLDVFNNVEHGTFWLKPLILFVIKNTGTCDWQVCLVAHLYLIRLNV